MKPWFVESDMSYPGAPISVQGVMGAAALDCLVQSDGHSRACRPIWEKPDGHGLGSEAIKVSSKFDHLGRPGEHDCVVVYWTGAGALVAAPWPEPPRPKAPSVITGPDWIRLPTQDQLARLYPPKALKDGVDGHTSIDCVVTDMGTLSACKLTSETPPDAGFGAAALATAPFFKMRPQTVDGQPVGGAHVVVPMAWKTVHDDAPKPAQP
ncbi:MAG TPA: TonB family protein [Caulobacteraceae bacterium]